MRSCTSSLPVEKIVCLARFLAVFVSPSPRIYRIDLGVPRHKSGPWEPPLAPHDFFWSRLSWMASIPAGVGVTGFVFLISHSSRVGIV